MQAVRCESCGHKALVAASQCPNCAHLLDIRDSFGELLPLSYCKTCDASYPARAGSCSWCGSAPARTDLHARVAKGVGAVAFAAMAVGVWLTRDYDASGSTIMVAGEAARTPSPAVAGPDAPKAMRPEASGALLPEVPEAAPLPEAQEAAPPEAREAAPPEAREALPPDAPSSVIAQGPAEDERGGVPPSDESTTGDAPNTIAGSAAGRAPATPRPLARVGAGATGRVARAATRTPTRPNPWRSVVVASWVTIRSAPHRHARLVGSIGPDSRVQVGEVRGEWQRVRMLGLSGWVQGGTFRPPPRAVVQRARAR